MSDVIELLSQSLSVKEFDSASDVVDYVIKKSDAKIDFETFVKLNELAQIQLDTGCSIKHFI